MAQDINTVILVGRLTRNQEIAYTPAGTAVGKFSLANSRRVKKADQWVDETNFFDCTLFGKTAESLDKHLLKGQQVCIEGKLIFKQWEKDGQKHSRVSIVVEQIQLLASPRGSNEPPINDDEANTYARNSNTQTTDYSGQQFDEDIPF